jgi:transmembrane 9 superfamily protein 2/4
LIEAGEEVIYSYDFIFHESKIEWASRWDHYLHSKTVSDSIHWVPIVNSNIILFIFTSFIAIIFCRALKRDINLINSVLIK